MRPRWEVDPAYCLRHGLDEQGRPRGHNEASDDSPVGTTVARRRRGRRHIESSDEDSFDGLTSPSRPNDTDDANDPPTLDATMNDLNDTDEEAAAEEDRTAVPVAQEPPSQDDRTTTNTSEEEERQAENNATMTTAAETSSTAMAVFVCSKKREATAKDLT
jgi:hypothetical protein